MRRRHDEEVAGVSAEISGEPKPWIETSGGVPCRPITRTAAFDLIERLHDDGDAWALDLATVGFLESLQNYEG